MGSRGQTITKPLTLPGKNKERGMIILRAESVKESNNMVLFQIQSQNLANKVPLCFGCCKMGGATYYEIQRATAGSDKNFSKVFTSEKVRGASNTTFKPVKIQYQQLCNSNDDVPIRFRFIVKKKEVCYGVTTVKELEATKKLVLRTEKGPGGTLLFKDFEVQENPNFVDYLRSGW